MATLAPPSASRTTAARPMPRDPPVTSATLFSKSLCMARRHSRNAAAMRIGVIGLGAIGGVVAERLSRAGLAPALAAGRRERLPGDKYDLILLCTRTADIESALGPAAPLLAADGAVVCLQNGLPEERAAKIVGPRRVLGAVIGWSASRGGEVTGRGKFTLGGESPRLADARRVLERAFPVKVTGNLPGRRGGPKRAHRSPTEPAPGRDGARDRKRTAEDRSAKLERAPLMKRWWLAYLAAALLVLLFHFRLALPGRALVANDFRALFIPLRTGLQHTVHAGEWPFWQ